MKVTVCIPTHNHGRFLTEAVNSVFRQTMTDFEIVIVDDASTDNTASLVTQWENDARLRYVRLPQRMGVAAVRNHCLQLARGRYIAWLDADDVYKADMLATQCAVLDRRPFVGLVHSGFQLIDEAGNSLPDWPQPFPEDVVEIGQTAFRELILSNYITAPTVLVRCHCYQHVGGYDLTIGQSSTDWEMWLRIALHYDIAFTQRPLAYYRQHHQTISAGTSQNGARLRCDARVIKRIFAQYVTTDHLPDKTLLYQMARVALACKALHLVGDWFTLGQHKKGISWAWRAVMWGNLWSHPAVPSFFTSLWRGQEYPYYRASKALMGTLFAHLIDSRFGALLKKTAVDNPEWEQTLYQIAKTIQQHVPPCAYLLTVTKYDPTLLHLSQRKGGHFPDRRLLPHGYPKDSDAALNHLDTLCQQGATHIVFSSATFWWLDYYTTLQAYLDEQCTRLWSDQACLIYQL